MEFKIGDHVKLSVNGAFPAGGNGDLYDRKECLARTWEVTDIFKSGDVGIREVGGAVGMIIKKENVDRTLVKV